MKRSITLFFAIFIIFDWSYAHESHSGHTKDTRVLDVSSFRALDEEASVSIISPKDGDTVSSPVTIVFGNENVELLPAGTPKENSGHHHLLINEPEIPSFTAPLPATEQIIHFGQGQTQTTIDLPPGTYILQLLLGNYLHIPHETPLFSKKIRIVVE